MSGKRYTEEFKIEAVKQITDRGYKISEVADGLGVTPKSLHDWIKKYGDTGSQRGYKRHRGFKGGDLSHVAPVIPPINN